MSVGIDDVVDVIALERWLDDSRLGDGPVTDARLLTGGTQNLLIRFRRGEDDLVLRRPSTTPRANATTLVNREARVLKALGQTAIPHPEFLGSGLGAGVAGDGPFLVMRAVDGVNPGEVLPESFDSTEVESIAEQAIDVLGEIAMVDLERTELTDFGRPEGFLHRQVERWTAEYQSYMQVEAYRATPLQGFAAVRGYLTHRVPGSFTPGLMHGDYHLGNLIVSEADARVAAVVDWEMSTIGDPLLDLGRYLAMLPDENETIVPSDGVTRVAESLGPQELVSRYEDRVGKPVTDLEWYVVLGCFKLGILLDGTWVRSLEGKADPGVAQMLHRAARTLFARASRMVGAGP